MHWGLCPVSDNNELLCMVILSIRQILGVIVDVASFLWVISVQGNDLLVVLSACFVSCISELNLSTLLRDSQDLAELVDQVTILFEFVGIKSFKISDKTDQFLWRMSEQIWRHIQFFLKVVFILVWPWLWHSSLLESIEQVKFLFWWWTTTHF